MNPSGTTVFPVPVRRIVSPAGLCGIARESAKWDLFPLEDLGVCHCRVLRLLPALASLADKASALPNGTSSSNFGLEISTAQGSRTAARRFQFPRPILQCSSAP